jgi:HSP20 family protein
MYCFRSFGLPPSSRVNTNLGSRIQPTRPCRNFAEEPKQQQNSVEARPEEKRESGVDVHRGGRVRRRGDEMDLTSWFPFDNFLAPSRWERDFFPSSMRDFDRMSRAMDNQFRSLQRDMQKQFDWSPRADITETKDSYIVQAELPGVPKENIKIDIEDDVLTLSGEKKSESESKDESGKVFRRERRYGTFERSFSLPDNAESKQIKANFENGVLKVTVPKKASTEKIQVQVE